MQVPIGSVFKDPGFYAVSSAAGNSNPVTVASVVVRGMLPRICAELFACHL